MNTLTITSPRKIIDQLYEMYLQNIPNDGWWAITVSALTDYFAIKGFSGQRYFGPLKMTQQNCFYSKKAFWSTQRGFVTMIYPSDKIWRFWSVAYPSVVSLDHSSHKLVLIGFKDIHLVRGVMFQNLWGGWD